MKRTLIVMMAILAVGAIAPLADAHPRQGGRAAGRTQREGMGIGLIARLPALQAELGLTDRQVEQIRANVTELREKNAQYRETLRGERRGAAKSLLANPQNVEQVIELRRKRAAVRDAMQENRIAATARVLSVLTPEQRTRLAERLSERRSRRGPRR